MAYKNREPIQLVIPELESILLSDTDTESIHYNQTK